MARNLSSASEQVTSTGIRIVGRAAAELVAQAAAIPLDPPPMRDAVWAARFRVRPRLGTGSAVPALLETIGAALRADWDGCPAVTRDTPFTRPPARFRGISWDVIGEPGAWRGELVWRHQHPRLAGTAVTTHLVIDEQQQITTMTLVAAAEGGVRGVRGIVGAGQSRPQILDEFRKVVALAVDGHDGSVHTLDDLGVEPFVRDVLLHDDRAWPVAVLAPLETGNFVVSPEELAEELFGLAPLYLIARHTGTFRLTDAIGDRRLSAYFGALRVYRPEFSCADRSDDHWLLVRDRLEDPLERAILVGGIAQATLHRALPVEGVAARRAARAAPTPAPEVPPPEAMPESAEHQPAAITPQWPVAVLGALTTLPSAMAQLAAQMHDLAGAVGHLVTVNSQLGDEIARLRTATAIRASSAHAVERRLEQIQASVALPVPDAETRSDEQVPADAAAVAEDGEAPPTLLEVVRQAASEYSDALLILDSAEASAVLSPYRDADRAGVVLQAMAYVSRRRQEGGLGSSMRAAFQELGIDYRAQIAESTSDKLRQQYRCMGPGGTVHECHEHIAIGSTYDPRYCLRIYFTSRAPSEPRFVIGHVGRHLTVMTSS